MKYIEPIQIEFRFHHKNSTVTFNQSNKFLIILSTLNYISRMIMHKLFKLKMY